MCAHRYIWDDPGRIDDSLTNFSCSFQQTGPVFFLNYFQAVKSLFRNRSNGKERPNKMGTRSQKFFFSDFRKVRIILKNDKNKIVFEFLRLGSFDDDV